MDLDEIKRGLRAEIKKRENEQYATFQCNVRQMCKDVLAKLEEQESEIAELKQKINESQTELELWRDGSIISEAHQKEIDEKRRSDYKRCLVIAKWCLTEKVYFHYRYDDWGDRGYDRPYKWKKVVFWSKWARRWLELAEKFKGVGK